MEEASHQCTIWDIILDLLETNFLVAAENLVVLSSFYFKQNLDRVGMQTSC
jgi:hypothetical protein